MDFGKENGNLYRNFGGVIFQPFFGLFVKGKKWRGNFSAFFDILLREGGFLYRENLGRAGRPFHSQPDRRKHS